MSPSASKSATQLEKKLYAFRWELCYINRTLRFPNELDEIKNLAAWYKVGCENFFSEEISEARRKIAGKPEEKHKVLELLLHSLSGKFADVSFYASKTTPIAAPISAIACELGRSILK